MARIVMLRKRAVRDITRVEVGIWRVARMVFGLFAGAEEGRVAGGVVSARLATRADDGGVGFEARDVDDDDRGAAVADTVRDTAFVDADSKEVVLDAKSSKLLDLEATTLLLFGAHVFSMYHEAQEVV